MRAYAGALLGGRMPTAALRASMARSADGPLRDRQRLRVSDNNCAFRSRVPVPPHWHASVDARGVRQRRRGVVPRSARTPSLAASDAKPRGSGRSDVLRFRLLHKAIYVHIHDSCFTGNSTAFRRIEAQKQKPSRDGRQCDEAKLGVRVSEERLRRDVRSCSGRPRPDAKRRPRPSWTRAARPLMDVPGGAVLAHPQKPSAAFPDATLVRARH